MDLRRAARATLVAATTIGTLALPAMPVLGAPPTTSEVDLGELSFAAPEQGIAAFSTSADSSGGWSVAEPVALDDAVLVGAVLEGVDHEAAEAVALELRSRTDGEWSDWTPMPIGDDGPDEDSDEHAAEKVTSEPFWVEGADAVQVRASGGEVPTMRLAGIEVAGGDGLAYDPEARAGSSAFAATSRPSIVQRSSWDPKGDCAPRSAPTYASDVRMAIVHHTAGSNTYTADKADDVVRSICLYHRNTRGWDDIGYNFLVDRYGKIYEGRAGGMTEPVQGAHTKGFNSGSTGISLMGNFSSVDPPSAMVKAMDRLLAWKLDVHHIDPNATTREVAGGGTRWPSGTLLDLPTVTTHGELNHTSCPGRGQTYASGSKKAAPRVLALGSDRIFGGQPPHLEQPVLGERPTWDLGFRPSGPWSLEVRNASGATLRRAAGNGASSRVTWDLRDASDREVAPGTYTVRVTHGDALPVETEVEVLGATTRVAGSSPAATAVELSRFTFDDPRDTAARRQHNDDLVISRASHPVSALAATVAASHNAPLLLSDAGGLGSPTRAEIARLKPDTAYIVGDTGQVPSNVESQLRSLGVKTIERIAGDQMEQTAGRAGYHVAERHGSREAVVVLTPGGTQTRADLVSGASYAAAQELPLLLTDRDGVHAATTWTLEQFAWSRVLVVGTGTIDQSTMNTITAAARTKSSSTKIVRIQGADSADTSRRVADALISARSGWTPDPNVHDVGREVLLLSTGDALDGVAALATADLRGSQTLLVDGADLDRSAAARSWLQSRADELTHALIGADTGRLSSRTAGQVEAILRSAGPHRATGEGWGRSQFSDVAAQSTHGPDVQRLWDLGLTSGCGDGKFCPYRPVQRQEMATFLTRMLELPETSQHYFSDVPRNGTHTASINAIAAADITQGYGNGTFGPRGNVTREHMASFLARALELPRTSRHYFSDVPRNGTHTANINALAAAGISQGYGNGTFGPDDLVTREQMASFLVRAVDWLEANG